MSTQQQEQFQADPQSVRRLQQQINQLMGEVAKLADAQLSPSEYFAEFLRRMLEAMVSPAGAVWTKTSQGNLQLQFQIGMSEVGLDQIENGRECHIELLRQVVQQGRGTIMPPRSGPPMDNGAPSPANLANFILLLAPIFIDKQVVGVVEAWMDVNRSPTALRGFLNFLGRMAEFASTFLRNYQLRTMIGQQHLWTQLESYSRQIHGSLNPREVAYLIANEGRRLIECDRVSIGVRQGSATRVEAISGADVIQKRSSLVQCMKVLLDRVILWGERLVYTGTKDESLPPRVLKALDSYLAESNSKFLIIMPLRDDREEKSKRPARSALMMECFEPTGSMDQLTGRMEVVARHAAPALYNAVEYKRIPLPWLWRPLAGLKDSLRGRNLAIFCAVLAGLTVCGLAMVFVPYPLRMDGRGELLPIERRIVYPRVTGRIVNLKVRPGDYVNEGDTLLTIEDLKLFQEMTDLTIKQDDAAKRMAIYKAQIPISKTPDEKAKWELEYSRADSEFQTAQANLDILRQQTRNPKESPVAAPISGLVITPKLEETLKDRTVKPGDPLLEIARREGKWEYELRIPEGQVGHVREALLNQERLTVEISLASEPGEKYYGWLYRDGLAGAATMHENEPVVIARVEVPLAKEGGINPVRLAKMPVGSRVIAKIHCGRRAIGYVWFYELWEFFYEHVLF